MKIFKYIAAALALTAVFTSCKDREVEFPMDKVDSSKAMVQVMYMEPVGTTAAEKIYRIELNGKRYENNNAEILARYNGFPGGGVSIYQTVDAGTVNIKLYRAVLNEKGNTQIDKTTNEMIVQLYYDKNFKIEAGKRAAVVIYDKDSDPAVVSEDYDIPTTTGIDGQADWAAVRFYNFMFDEKGQPMKGKLQVRMQDDASKEYVPVAEPVAFGEATSWFLTPVHKTVYNSSGSQRRDLDVIYFDEEGNNQGQLTFTNSKGNVTGFTDWWTLYIGRGYAWYIRGTRNDNTYPVAITQWTRR